MSVKWIVFLCFLSGIATAQNHWVFAYEGTYAVGHYQNALHVQDAFELNSHWQIPISGSLFLGELGGTLGTGVRYNPNKTLRKFGYQDYSALEGGLFVREKPTWDTLAKPTWLGPWVGVRLGRIMLFKKTEESSQKGLHFGIMVNWVGNDMLARFNTGVLGLNQIQFGSFQVGFRVGFVLH